MKTDHLSLNRPAHLARRDVYFERAVDILYTPVGETELNNNAVARLKQVEKVLNLLKRAENHASLSTLSHMDTPGDRDFLHFLVLISQNVQSAHAMMNNQVHLEEAKSFLRQFLNASDEESSIPAVHYARRADDILQGLWHLLRLALAPYRTLQQENLSKMTDADKKRYYTAAKSAQTELSDSAQ